MALDLQPPDGRKRVKVYELRDNDWFDRGTGFCTGQTMGEEPRIFVESEDQPNRVLLETKITKDDGYQKQQGLCPPPADSWSNKWLLMTHHATETLIVWTEQNGTDMALSFQEAEGCAVIWDFVNTVQQHLLSLAAADDALSDDLESYQSIVLPAPELGNLAEIEQIVRAASMTQAGRDALCKFIIRDEYISKLVPLVPMAEDLESLADLHRLCNIMKSLILLNDNTIIETVVADPVILGVVGALEYDPEFPTHKANHRQYLADQSRYKEVVPIKDPIIRRKIRSTWRLQYLKDVVLARILDDPTFSVLNSLIFFNQMEIVNHIQSNAQFLRELFAVFDPRNLDAKRKDDAVQFLHQCTAIAKNLQTPARASLFTNFINYGLFAVIAFAVKHPNPAMRTTGIDILMALLDHDPVIMRGYMLKAVNEKKTPLTDTLIDLLHTETDLGVKNQLSEAVRSLLDPQIPLQDPLGRPGTDYFKARSANLLSDTFVQQHFDESAKRLFRPLKELADRHSLDDLTFQEVTLYSHLVEILTFFVLALKFFRALVNVSDTFWQALITHTPAFGLCLDIIYETMPRDNLLNSACLELFDYIKRSNCKSFIIHIVEEYREKLESINYVETFQHLILRYDQMQGYGIDADLMPLGRQDEDSTPRRMPLNGGRWQGVREMDAAEEEYFNTSDDDEEWTPDTRAALAVGPPNGAASPAVKSLVDYPDDDDDDDIMDTKPEDAQPAQPLDVADVPAEAVTSTDSSTTQTPPAPERLAEKRRREEEDEDELMKLTAGPKRRSSTASNSSAGSLRRKNGSSMGMAASDKSATAGNAAGGAPVKRIAINLGPTLKSSVDSETPDSETASDENNEKENNNSRGD
ncbi:hypothetical protein N7510_003182 [Penicillium lagena]|uniref:uncharacterized protein n=1 Tax=Penicillium lagena TaxID=94218 RepID=UPI002541089F|nr:uncharacterized protein N7510_003182 [Penicillium lagena]KAJ5619198.1 hypothetical protein N7510_003182 [Penicillium lagena]